MYLKIIGLWGKLLDIVLDLWFFFFQYGIVYYLQIIGNSISVFVYFLFWSYMFVVILFYFVILNVSD